MSDSQRRFGDFIGFQTGRYCSNCPFARSRGHGRSDRYPVDRYWHLSLWVPVPCVEGLQLEVGSSSHIYIETNGIGAYR